MVQKKFREMGIRPQTTVTLPGFIAAPEFIKNTPLITIVHTRLAKKAAQRDDLVCLELPSEFRDLSEFDYCSYAHPSRDNDQGLAWLLKQLELS
jgi:DNA-binding transcriptional LysR family regulator